MRTLLHVLVSIALWVVFAWYWDIVTNEPITRGTILAAQVLSVLVVSGTIVTLWWIAHNLRRGRRNRRSTARAAAPEQLHADTLGRAVLMPGLAALREARAVEIRVSGDQKVYDPVDPGSIAGGD